MGWYVHLHVAFACDRNEPVAELAKKHRSLIDDESDGAREAQWFLDDLSKRTGENPGPKGGLSLWGIVGNYSRGDTFTETLRPFWTELLTAEVGGIGNFEHIIVFEEQEQSDRTIAYEISLNLNELDEPTGGLMVKRHECPFHFGQM